MAAANQMPAGSSKRNMEQRYMLEQAAVDGQAWLKTILDLEHHSEHELATQLCDSPLKPFWISQAQALLFYSFSKTAAFVGKAKGRGFIIARLPTSHPTLIKFSAPLFLDISFVSAGLSLGHTTTCSFTACMSAQFQQQLLAAGRRPLRGLDGSLLCGSSLRDRSDVLTMNCVGGMVDTVGVSTVSGGMLDLSFASGSLRVDTAKNTAVYGDIKPSQILDGTVDPPPELQPLYSDLSLIVHQAHAERPSSAPSRVSASLERFSTGLDPEKVLVLNDGTALWQDGRPARAPLARHSI